MKYIICVGDGMADFPIDSLGNKTPLAYAQTPFMDSIAAEGSVGRVQTVPEGFPPGSDVANMALMGYDPAKYYTGRAPIEAASLGVSLGENDTAFRCNLVTIEQNRMVDYSAGHIESNDASVLIETLQQECGSETRHFYPGVSYRHLCVISGMPAGKLDTTPPHDITGQ
jgi:2,3-bisphosphoglycerate-independent phosphoglycerate mutase